MLGDQKADCPLARNAAVPSPEVRKSNVLAGGRCVRLLLRLSPARWPASARHAPGSGLSSSRTTSSSVRLPRGMPIERAGAWISWFATPSPGRSTGHPLPEERGKSAGIWAPLLSRCQGWRGIKTSFPLRWCGLASNAAWPMRRGHAIAKTEDEGLSPLMNLADMTLHGGGTATLGLGLPAGLLLVWFAVLVVAGIMVSSVTGFGGNLLITAPPNLAFGRRPPGGGDPC